MKILYLIAQTFTLNLSCNLMLHCMLHKAHRNIYLLLLEIAPPSSLGWP